jgi:hypothetical protein
MVVPRPNRIAATPACSWSRWVVPGIGALLVLVAGCGGAQFDGTTYRGDGFAFRIPPVPAVWESLRHSHAGLAYRDPPSHATILLNGRCHVDGEDVPLLALTNHLFMQFTERDVVLQEVVPFDGREAMHTELSAKLDGVPMRFDVWVLKKDHCVYDLIYFAPHETASRGLPEFQRVVRGFATVGIDAD